MEIEKKLWGTHDGKDVWLISLFDGQVEICISNFGATLTHVGIPGRDGSKDNIVLGYDSLQEYIDDEFYMGCVVGRFAGRIAGASFDINGTRYALPENDQHTNHLHGGYKGFGKQVFTLVEEIITPHSVSVELHYHSPHLEEGYPGNLDCRITYRLSDNHELSIEYHAITDLDTHISLTNHSYFNLARTKTEVLDHELFIDADDCLVTDADFIPSGALRQIDNSGYSFKHLKKIGEDIKNLESMGYNDCYVLNKSPRGAQAVLKDDRSGRTLTLQTDMPGLLLYTGDYLGKKFIKNNGVCLEAQFFPDTPHHNSFPSTLLKAGEEWSHFTSWRFEWEG